jgi:hypothetical protein
MSEGELREKSLFKNEQARKEGSFISHLKAYWKLEKAFCLVFRFNV